MSDGPFTNDKLHAIGKATQDAIRAVTSQPPGASAGREERALPLSAEERTALVCHARIWQRNGQAAGCAATLFDKDVAILRYEASLVAAESALAAERAAGEAAAARFAWLNTRSFTMYRGRDPEHGKLEDHAVVCDEDTPSRKNSRHGHLGSDVQSAIDEAMRCNRGHAPAARALAADRETTEETERCRMCGGNHFSLECPEIKNDATETGGAA